MTPTSSAAAVVGTTVIAQATAVTLDLNTIILAIIGLLGTSVTGYLALRMAALAADAKESKESLKEVHVAVNSAKSVLETKVDDLIKQNVELAKENATLQENKRAAELAKAVASAPPGLVVMPAVVSPTVVPVVAPVVIESAVTPAPSSPTRMGEAITELKAAAAETSVAAEEASVKADKTVQIVEKQHGIP